MSKQVSPTLIGSFFLAALGLVIIAIIMFGGGNYFEKKDQFVLFFHAENNLNGLNAVSYTHLTLPTTPYV